MNKVLVFITGAVVGGVIVRSRLKKSQDEAIKAAVEEEKKYSDLKLKRLRKRIDELNAQLNKGKDIPKNKVKEVETKRIIPSDSKLNVKVDTNRVAYDKMAERYKDISVEDEDDIDDVDEVYAIKPEEFGDIYDYTAHTLVYYADGYLIDDETDEEVDIDIVGGDAILDDIRGAAYFRNDVRLSDYKIVESASRYYEDEE